MPYRTDRQKDASFLTIIRLLRLSAEMQKHVNVLTIFGHSALS